MMLQSGSVPGFALEQDYRLFPECPRWTILEQVERLMDGIVRQLYPTYQSSRVVFFDLAGPSSSAVCLISPQWLEQAFSLRLWNTEGVVENILRLCPRLPSYQWRECARKALVPSEGYRQRWADINGRYSYRRNQVPIFRVWHALDWNSCLDGQEVSLPAFKLAKEQLELGLTPYGVIEFYQLLLQWPELALRMAGANSPQAWLLGTERRDLSLPSRYEVVHTVVGQTPVGPVVSLDSTDPAMSFASHRAPVMLL